MQIFNPGKNSFSFVAQSLDSVNVREYMGERMKILP